MKTIPLNIMLSYPVKWTKQQVLRDIVQNFYDDLGAKKFYSLFKTTYKPIEKEITLSIASKGFSYEWLLHMGASSKQGNPGKYAGLFGEGFKMAALCALRDYNWKIKMRSRKKMLTSTYCHELSHCFGGDNSPVFSRALTDVIVFFNRLWISKF